MNEKSGYFYIIVINHKKKMEKQKHWFGKEDWIVGHGTPHHLWVISD